MRTSVGRTIFRRVPSRRASAFPGIVLRIEFTAFARGLSLLAGIVVLVKPGTAASAFAVWAIIRFALDNWGRFQELREFIANRGPLMKWIGLVITSHWLPIGLFVVAVAVLAGIHFDIFPTRKKKNNGLMQPAPSRPLT